MVMVVYMRKQINYRELHKMSSETERELLRYYNKQAKSGKIKQTLEM